MRWLILTAVVGCTSPGPNLLRNSDFEELDENGWLTEWTNHDGNPDGAIVVVKTPRVSGEHAVQWQIEAAGSGWEYFMIQSGIAAQDLEPGSRYELSGWYFADQEANVALNYIVRGRPDFEPDIGTVSDAAMYPTVVGQFAPFRFEFEIPDDVSPASYEVYLHAIKFSTIAVNLTLDNVTLHEI